MKFTCYKNDLVEAMQLVIRSVAVKPMTLTLAGVYLNANENSLELQSNNLNSAVSVKIPVNTEVGGEVVVSGKTFNDFIRNMPEDTVDFFGEEASNIFSIGRDSAKVELLTLPAYEFPKIKPPETDRSFKIRAIALRNLIRRTAFAVSKEDDRPVFKGCHFILNGDRVTVAATNMHRISIAKDIVRENYDDGLLTIPADVLRSLMQYIDPNDVENYIEIKYSQRQVSFKFNNVFLTARLLEGEFPDYNRIFEDNNVLFSVEVNKSEFQHAIEFVSLIGKDGGEYSKTVKLEISQGRIKILVGSPDLGEASTTVTAEGDEKTTPIDLAFNTDYMIDALRSMDAQRLFLDICGMNKPLFIREHENRNYNYVITPVRI